MELNMAARKHSAPEALSDYWSDVRPKRLSRAAPEPVLAVDGFLRWATELADLPHRSFITVPEAAQRSLFHTYLGLPSFQTGVVNDLVGNQTRDWLAGNVLESFRTRVAALRIPEDCMTKELSVAWVDNQKDWEIFWGLVFTPEFLVEEPLRSMVDKGFYLVHSVYRAIWEARFVLREKGPGLLLQQMGSSVLQWLQGLPLTDEDIQRLTAIGIHKRVESDREKSDVLLFLLTLAAHNGLISRVVIAFNGIERALRPDSRALLRQLDAFCGDLDRWAKLGAPVGAVLGIDLSRGGVSSLRKLNVKLAERVTTGLEWTHV